VELNGGVVKAKFAIADAESNNRTSTDYPQKKIVMQKGHLTI